MTNLLEETTEAIRLSGHSPSDIVFIGSENTGHRCTWEEFTALANVEYDSGFGAQEVASDLIVVFSDGARMDRQEYDGSEGWSFQKPFTVPEETHAITRLVVPQEQVGWCTLAECNAERTTAEP